MTTDLQTYYKLLAEQLRINGMKERRVSEVVAQVQAHTADTREDPVDAFGQPADYARQWVVPTRGLWLRRIIGGIAGVTSLFSILKGIATSGPWTGQIDVEGQSVVTWFAWIVAMALLPWTFELWLARRRANRYGAAGGVQDWAFRMIAFVLFMAAVWVALFVLMDGESSPVLFSAPKWAFLAVGFVCLPGLAFIATTRRDSLPEPPGPVTWKTRVRRALINR